MLCVLAASSIARFFQRNRLFKLFLLFLFSILIYLKSSNFLLTQAFKWALLFPTFLICSYFSLLFHENVLLSILFHYKMSCMRKNPEIFSLLAPALFVNQCIFFSVRGHAAKHLKIFTFTPKSLCLAWTIVTAIILLI